MLNVTALTEPELSALHAAMIALVHDVHQPQDTMQEETWKVAEDLCDRLDRNLNFRLGYGPISSFTKNKE
jgi:hypothetical protein